MTQENSQNFTGVENYWKQKAENQSQTDFVIYQQQQNQKTNEEKSKQLEKQQNIQEQTRKNKRKFH